MSPRLAFALEAATRAGRSTLAHFQTGVPVEIKADQSPVTIADRQAERIIRDMISEAFPDDEILGEEEGGAKDVPDRWVVDPIDGTKSFICGVPLYATLISYEQDRRPILGVAYFPALDELVYAEVGTGAFSNGRPIHVSQRTTLDQAVLACGSHRHMDQLGHAKGFTELAYQVLATRTWGDAYGHALVAMGRVDAMVDPIVNRWDLSAVRVIVEEAGGRFTDFVGSDPFAKGDTDLEAISTNSLLHTKILEAFAP